ncbi:MAG: protein-disulfide reductase DsbD domain-containing protein, partial [Gammaproteobacteria bacterium]
MPIRHLLLLLALSFTAMANPAFADEEPLRVEDAFRYTVNANADTITVDWDIEEGYYLYRPRMSFKSATDGVVLGEPNMPKGKEKEDEFFGKTEIYRGAQTVTIPVTNSAGAGSVILEIRSQGCADFGLCYPPQRWSAPVTLAAASTKLPSTLLNALGGDNSGIVTGGDEFLDPEVAFRFFADMADDYTVRVRFEIADGYYLYKDKFEFTGQSDLAQVGRPQFPQGKIKEDEFFGEVEVFYGQKEILIPISRASPAAGELELNVAFQGCAEDGICYPPMDRNTLVALSQASTDAPAEFAANDGGSTAPESEQDGLAKLISTGSLPIVLLTFFGLGVGLAFTPCVLPMVPILSSMIMGQGENVTARKGFIMSLAYVLPMALTYTVAGVAVALAGKNIQAVFQNPYILVTFALVFVVLAMAMFDVWQFQMPTGLQNRLN